MIRYFKSDAAEAEGGDDGASDATDPRAASDDLCTLPPLPLSKLSLSKDDDPEDLSLLQYFRVKCYAVLIFLSPFCFVHFADYELENAKNDEENGCVLTLFSRAWGKVK